MKNSGQILFTRNLVMGACLAAALAASGRAAFAFIKEHHFGPGYSPLITRTKSQLQVWQPVGIDDRMTTSGTHPVIVLRVDFSDVQFRSDHDLAYYQNEFMGPGGVKDFYLDQSEGKITLNFTVSPQVYRMPKPLSQYDGTCDPAYGAVVLDAVQAADSDINFKNFDALILMYAGIGDLWAFMCPSGYFTPVNTNDGATVYEYVEIPESDPAEYDLNSSIQSVASHETGHQLGLPDLYAYGWSGVGIWDLMSYGQDEITQKGFSFSAWCKVQLGWVIPQVKVGVDEDITLNSVETSADVIVKAPVGGNPSAKEYFLIEYRTKTGYDANLPGGGLLVWHAKDDSPYDSNTSVPSDLNSIHMFAPLLVEQADGLEELETGASYGDAGDPFPGSTSNRTFSATSNPTSNRRDGSASGVEVTNITEAAGQGQFHLRVGSAPGVFTVKITNPANSSYVTGFVTISATTQGSQTIQYVDFTVDGAPLSRDPTPPYSAAWDSVGSPEGSHTIMTVATDLSGNTATDSVLVFVDRTPPTIQFTSPAGGAYLSAIAPVSAQASDNTGVRQVDFFVDNSLKQTALSPPYNFALNTVQYSDGAHVLKVVATDGAGLTQQGQINVTLDNSPPAIVIDKPEDGAILNGIVDIAHTVSDTVGILNVELRIDGIFVSALNSPYSYSWDTTVLTGKTHVITSTARDFAGNTAVATATVTVKNDLVPPTASFSIPPANAAVCGTVTAIANGSDDRALQRMDFFVDNVADPNSVNPLSLSSPPFQFTYKSSPSSPGFHTLKATAVDAADNTADAILPVQIRYPTHLPAANYPATGPMTMTFIVNSSGVASATLLYRGLNSTGLFNGLSPSSVAGTTYVFTLPASQLPPTGLEYYLLLQSSYYSCETPRYTVASPYQPGDANLDGQVDELDAIEIAWRFGATAADAAYQPLYDPNLDGVIDQKDIDYVFSHFTG